MKFGQRRAGRNEFSITIIAAQKQQTNKENFMKKPLSIIAFTFALGLAAFSALNLYTQLAATSVVSAAPAANGECRVRLSVNDPILNGTPANPQGARVTWTVDNVPPCYRIESYRVTFNFTLADGSSHQRVVNAPGNATQASTQLNLTAPLPRRDRPTVITATVVGRAVPIDNQINGTGNATTELRP
jgi:hypothetical protein